MSKKDYQAIARAIYETRQAVPAFSQTTDVMACGVWTRDTPHNELVSRIAGVLACDSPRFDPCALRGSVRDGHNARHAEVARGTVG